MSDENDPIIDALLDEVLGGQEPPDLTQRILGAHEALLEMDGAEPVYARRQSERRNRELQATRRRERLTGWAVAGVVLLGGTMFGLWAWQEQERFREANSVPAFVPKTESSDAPVEKTAIAQDTPDKFEGQELTTVIPGWAEMDRLRSAMREQRRQAADAARIAATENDASEVLSSPAFQRIAQVERESSDAEVVTAMNEHLVRAWQRKKFARTDPITEREWVERSTLVLLGRRPTNQEVDGFDNSRDREAYLDYLFNHTDFASHWAKQFADILVGSAPRKNFDRTSFESYLADSFSNGKPLDQLAFELLTARGAATSDASSSNPAVNFLLAHFTEGSASQTLALDKLCQVFLGTQIQCARCHDHPFDSHLKQQNYWEMAAFLTQVQKEKLGGEARLVDRDYAGSNPRKPNPDDADLFYTRNENGEVAYPRFPGHKGPPIRSGRIAEVNRRAELAYSIVESDRFAAAMVSRLWRKVFGAGFTQPVDDLGKHQSVTNGQLFAALTREFKNSGFDMRSGLRWMLRSEAFLRSERAKGDPLIAKSGSDWFSSFASPKLFSHPVIEKPLAVFATNTRQQNPYGALGNLGATRKISPAEAAAARRRVNQLHRLVLLNPDSSKLLGRLADRAIGDADAVKHLFYAFVGRSPTDDELKSGVTILENRARSDGLIEIGQIILNSREFITEH